MNSFNFYVFFQLQTYTTDHMTADSAATATAMLCGEKTINDAVCVNQNVSLAECATQAGNHLKSILHHSIEEGWFYYKKVYIIIK